MTVMTLKDAISKGWLKFHSWLETFSPERFEVNFSDIIKGRGAKEYLDPDSFYNVTHLTERMSDVLTWCLSRTAKKSDKAVIHLATGFGGGKSHLLTLLYHVYQSRTVPDPSLLAKLALKEVPEVKLIALDGHDLTYPFRKHPALEEVFRDSKEAMVEAIRTQGRPVVILLDEFVVHLAKCELDQQKQELAHLHTLISAINAVDDSVLVITNPKGTPAYARAVEMVQATLEQFIEASSDVASILGRVTTPIVPVAEQDFPAILRVRLVESYDRTLAKSVEKHMGKLTNRLYRPLSLPSPSGGCPLFPYLPVSGISGHSRRSEGRGAGNQGAAAEPSARRVPHAVSCGPSVH